MGALFNQNFLEGGHFWEEGRFGNFIINQPVDPSQFKVFFRAIRHFLWHLTSSKARVEYSRNQICLMSNSSACEQFVVLMKKNQISLMKL